MDYLDAQDTDPYPEGKRTEREERIGERRPLPSPPPYGNTSNSSNSLIVSSMASPSPLRSGPHSSYSPSQYSSAQYSTSSPYTRQSPSAPVSAPSSASRRQYIWDEVEKEAETGIEHHRGGKEHSHGKEHSNGKEYPYSSSDSNSDSSRHRDLTKTYVNPSATVSTGSNRRKQEESTGYETKEQRNQSPRSYSKEPSTEGERSSIDPSVSDMVLAVKNKVDVMKVELRERSETVRDLQAELARLRKAKERKEEKCERIWQVRVNDLKEEQNKILRRQKDFYEKISEDSKVLSEKDEALREKNEHVRNGGDSTVQRIMLEGQKKIDRMDQQLVADERVSFEKV